MLRWPGNFGATQTYQGQCEVGIVLRGGTKLAAVLVLLADLGLFREMFDAGFMALTRRRVRIPFKSSRELCQKMR
jgi:hypothetical protein